MCEREWLGVMVFHCVRGEMSVCQYVTVCDCMSVCKWKVCGVEMALMELDVVHNRQDITSERGLKERKRERRRGREGEKKATWPNVIISHDKKKNPRYTVQISQTLVHTRCIKAKSCFSNNELKIVSFGCPNITFNVPEKYQVF